MKKFMDLTNKSLEKFVNENFNTNNAKVVIRDERALGFDVRCNSQHKDQIILLCPSANGKPVSSTDVKITKQHQEAWMKFLIKNNICPFIDWLENGYCMD